MATGQEIVDEVRNQLNDGDATNLRWTDAEMLDFINAAQRQIVMLLPEANIVTEQVTIAAGSGSRQVLPPGGIKFVHISNYDDTAGEDGPPLRQFEPDALDTFAPEWRYESEIANYWTWPSTETEFTNVRFEGYFHDPIEPKEYFLFPPADAISTFDVLLTYSKIPTALTSLANTFALDDEYINATVEYVSYRAMVKDGRYGNGPEERRELWNSFIRSLGLKIEAEGRVTPERPPEG